MKYLLIHHYDGYLKKNLIDGYLQEGFVVVVEEQEDVLLKKSDLSIVDEEIYYKVLFSFIRRSQNLLGDKRFVADLTNAFLCAFKQNGFSKFDNRFLWHIRTSILQTVLRGD